MFHYFDPVVDLRPPRKFVKRKRHQRDSGEQSAGEYSVIQSSSDGDEDEGLPATYPHARLTRDFDLAPGSRRIPSEPRNLKHQHVATLNTILHKCLLEGDFTRAGKAFGVLLRVDFNGKRMDLRKNELWGIGAEILLRRDTEPRCLSLSPESDPTEHNPVSSTMQYLEPAWFTEEGFRATKDYYERLILQYPHKKTRPHQVSAMNFYPAMFGLWIWQTQDRSRRARLHIRAAHPASDGVDVTLDRVDNDDEVKYRFSDERSDLQTIGTRELREARQIAERLDELTLLPPYDRNIPLLNLKGFVALWLVDILLRAGNRTTISEEISEQTHKARQSFLAVEEHGGTVSSGVMTSLRNYDA